jgi:threonine/homoserine/homoserine lactone efflux protein
MMIIPPAQLSLFFVLVFGVVVLPGLDMAYVMGSALAGGRGKGFAALAGVVAGGACHVLMTALGISVVLRLVPGLFNAMLLAGALYIAWIGLSLLRSDASGGGLAVRGATAQSWWRTFRQGMLTCLLNPKAYLFMLAVFPQFLRPGHGALWGQVLVLWLVVAANQLGVYGGLALLAARMRNWLALRPAAGAMAGRCVGVLLLGAAAFTGIEGWQRL